MNLPARVRAGRSNTKFPSSMSFVCELPPKGVTQIYDEFSCFKLCYLENLSQECPGSWVLIITDIVKLIIKITNHNQLCILFIDCWPLQKSSCSDQCWKQPRSMSVNKIFRIHFDIMPIYQHNNRRYWSRYKDFEPGLQYQAWNSLL